MRVVFKRNYYEALSGTYNISFDVNVMEDIKITLLNVD